MTCFNRRETTLRALRRVYAQSGLDPESLRVVLTDDGSSDGTADAVRREFPDVKIISGDGNLYWVGGMRAAWAAAGPADFYLWLNDDVELNIEAVAALLRTYDEQDDSAAIVAGATCDSTSGKTNTGGLWRRGWYNCGVHEPRDTPVLCDSLDGNIAMVPRPAFERLGMLSDKFTHYFGDADYGLRARQAGVPILLAPRHVGICQPNSRKNSVDDHDLSFRQRWQHMTGPKGFRPPRQWWAFVRAHAPRPKSLYWAVPYLLFVVEHLFRGRLQIRRNVRRPATRIQKSPASQN
jgi:GT2 family glycosyltransferase